MSVHTDPMMVISPGFKRFQSAGKHREDGVKSHHGKLYRAAQGLPPFNANKVCNYCKGRGHWKAKCPVKSTRNTTKNYFDNGQVKSNVLAVAVTRAIFNTHDVDASCAVPVYPCISR